MKHLGRVHRISISWLSQMFSETLPRDPDYMFVEYGDSNKMTADVRTKVIDNSEKRKTLLVLINIAVVNNFYDLIQRSNNVRNALSKVPPTDALDVGDA